MAYDVLKELEIPSEAHLRPIPDEILDLYGFNPDIPQQYLSLAQLVISGSKEPGLWFISASDVLHPSSPPNLEATYGAIAIKGRNTSPEEVFAITEDWVRGSENSAWVPGPITEFQVNPNIIHGLILVRGRGGSMQAAPEQSRVIGGEEELAAPTEWVSKVFVQETEGTGISERWGRPMVPVGAPMGIQYVPSGPDYFVEKEIKVGLSPVEQFVEFLNEHGSAIKDWEIVDGSHSATTLTVVYRTEIEVEAEPGTDAEDGAETEPGQESQREKPGRLVYSARPSRRRTFYPRG